MRSSTELIRFFEKGWSLGDKVLAFVLSFYGLRPEEVIRTKKIIKIIAGGRAFALKRVTSDPFRIPFYLAAMEYLWARGFQTISRVIRTLDGGLFVQLAEESFFLTEWIEGRQADFSCPAELETSVKLLAELHCAGKGFQPPEGFPARNHIGCWPEKWRQRIADLKIMALAADSGETVFDRAFRLLLPGAIDQGEAAIRSLDSLGYDAYSRDMKKVPPLCHRDMVCHNIIFQGTRAFLIDFEYCVQDSPVTDLARLIRTCVGDRDWDLSLGRDILCWYSTARPLPDLERQLIPVVLSFPHELWRTGHRWYFSQERSAGLLKSLPRGLAIGRKERFLDHLAEVPR